MMQTARSTTPRLSVEAFDRFMVQVLEPQEEGALIDIAYNRIKRDERRPEWTKLYAAFRLADALHELWRAQMLSGVRLLDLRPLRTSNRLHAAALDLALCPAPDPGALRWKRTTFRHSYTWRYMTGEDRERVENVIAEDEAFLQAHPVKARRRSHVKEEQQ